MSAVLPASVPTRSARCVAAAVTVTPFPMPHGRAGVWGGPSGVYSGAQLGLPLKHFGHGTVVGAGGTPRVGAAHRWDIEKGAGFSWAGVASPGDSGSGVLTLTGEAAGDLTHLAVDINGNVVGVAGTRMPGNPEIARGWSLVNGSQLPL